jgi:hypothetical protein
MSCKHVAYGRNGFVCLANDDDGYYVQQFSTREQIEEFINHVRQVANEVWPEGTNEKEIQQNYAELIRKQQQNYIPQRPLTPEEIKEHNKQLDESPGPSIAKNYITPPDVLEALANDTTFNIG